MISDAQRTVGLNLLGSPKDLGQRALSKSSLGLLRRPGLLPLVKDINRHEAAASLEGLAEGGLALDPVGFGVDVCEALAQNGTSPQRMTSKLRSPALVS